MARVEARGIEVHMPLAGAARGMLRGVAWGLALALPVYVLDSDEPYREGYFLAFPVLGALIGIPVGMITYGELYEF